MKKTFLALAFTCAAAATMAQSTPYATISEAKGLVTVTSGNQLTNATSGMELTRGVQVMNTSAATSTIVFASGCSVSLAPGQTLLVTEEACTTLAQNKKSAPGGKPGVFTQANMVLGAWSLGVLSVATQSQVTRSPSSGS